MKLIFVIRTFLLLIVMSISVSAKINVGNCYLVTSEGSSHPFSTYMKVMSQAGDSSFLEDISNNFIYFNATYGQKTREFTMYIDFDGVRVITGKRHRDTWQGSWYMMGESLKNDLNASLSGNPISGTWKLVKDSDLCNNHPLYCPHVDPI